jgi:oligosaccharide repeat unit polymerase
MNNRPQRRQKKSAPAAILFFVVSIMGLFIAVAAIMAGGSRGTSWPMLIVITTSVWFLSYLYASYSYYRSIYLFSTAFLLGLFLFHLGLVYQVAFGVVEAPSWTEGDSGELMERAGWFVYLALCSFGCGAAIGINFIRGNSRDIEITPQVRKKVNSFLGNQAIGLGIACIIFLIMMIYAYGNVFTYSRAELFNLQVDTRGFGLLMMVLPGAVILYVLSAQTAFNKIMAYCLAAFVFLFILFSGYRSAALFPSMVGAVLWVKSGRKIPKAVAVSAVVSVLFAISVAGIFRQMGSYDSLTAEKFEQAAGDAEIGSSITEMGQTLGVLAQVLRLVPEVDQHTYGYSYWTATKHMLPNIGITTQSEESRMAVRAKAFFHQEELVKMAPADWITFRLNRWKFDNGQGVGFSAIAEPYLNFGTFGVIAYFVLLGVVLAQIDKINVIARPYMYLLLATSYWPFLRTVRNDFGNFSKPFAFIIIILLIWNVSLAVIGQRRKP